MGILSGIANPALADPFGSFEQGAQIGRDEETRRLVCEILGATRAGQLGALGRVNAPLAIKMAGQLKFDDDPKKQLNEFVGTVQLANAVGKAVGPRESLAILVESRNRIQAMVDKGMMRPGATTTLDGMIQKFDEDPKQGLEALNLMNDALVEQGLAKSPEVDKSISEIRKGLRSNIESQLKIIRADTKAVEENFTKVKSLVKEIKVGNRIAASFAIIALVKIGDDSTVREGELKTALANQNPIAAVFDFLLREGVTEDVARSVSVAVDPLNPATMNTENILATANSLVGARVPSIQTSFAESVELSLELSPRGRRSVIGNTLKKRIAGLSDLLVPSQDLTGPTDEQIAELKAARPDLSEEQIRAALQ